MEGTGWSDSTAGKNTKSKYSSMLIKLIHTTNSCSRLVKAKDCHLDDSSTNLAESLKSVRCSITLSVTTDQQSLPHTRRILKIDECLTIYPPHLCRDFFICNSRKRIHLSANIKIVQNGGYLEKANITAYDVF
jgi:hypothetical protein